MRGKQRHRRITGLRALELLLRVSYEQGRQEGANIRVGARLLDDVAEALQSHVKAELTKGRR